MIELNAAIKCHIFDLPEDIRDGIESHVLFICDERKAHTLIEQFAVLRLAIAMHQELALENYRLGQPETVRLEAAKQVFGMLEHNDQMPTAEIAADIHDKALRYLRDKSFREETQKRLHAAGLPKDSVEREVARRYLEATASFEKFSTSLANRNRSALKALHDAGKLAER